MKFGRRVITPVLVQAVIAVAVSASLAFIVVGQKSMADAQLAGDWAGWASLLLIVQILSGAAFLTLAYRRWSRLNMHLRSLPLRMRAIAQGRDDPYAPSDPTPGELAPLVRRIRSFAEEVYESRSAKAELERMALTDPLTGLPNRRGLVEFINKVIGSRRGWIDPQTVGVMHIDLDHFKTINDTLGHDAGDHVLREATKRMQATVRETDLIARLGGDEFALVLPGIESRAVLERLAERLIEKFEPPIVYGEELCRVGISIGVVMGHQHSESDSPSRLLTNADIALTHAKSTGRGRYAVFNPSMASAAAAKTGMAAEIRQGLLDDAFFPRFQPIIDKRANLLTGVSVSPCWHHPEKGPQSLETFRKAAEAHNMIEEIGMQILEKACSVIREWRRDGLETGLIHMSLSRAQLLAPGMVDKVTWALDDCGIEPERFAVDVSERDCQGRSVEIIFANLDRLREYGLKIALSEFGVTNASLGNLSTLSSTQLFCDAETIEGYRQSSAQGPDLLAGLLAVIRAMKLTVVVRHVDEPSTEQILLENGFHELQGVSIAEEMDHGAMEAWLRDRQSLSQAAAG